MTWRSALSPDAEPGRVVLIRGEWADPDRNGRIVPYKIYCPDDGGDDPLPVVLWSHGLGGSRDGGGFISRFLSAHGYIVVHVQHPGTDSTLWEGKPGHPWDAIRAAKIPRRATLQRYRDIPFALDRLVDAVEQPFSGRLDFSRLGMSGHSFGANTTQIMAGQALGYGRRQYRLHEPRFRAGILYSPVPSYNRKDPPQTIYGPIAIPLFHMTGTDDTSPVEGFDYTRRLEVFEHSGGPDQHLMVLNGGDHMVYNGSRGKLGDNPLRAGHEAIIKLAALAFWDAYLKGDKAAEHWLKNGDFQTFLNGGGRYTFRA